MKKIIIILFIKLVLSITMFSQLLGRSHSSYERARAVLREDQNQLDERTKKLMRKHIKALYQPPFHIGFEFGFGLTNTNVPSDHTAAPKIGFQGNIIGTYYFKEWLAIYFNLGWNRINMYFEDQNLTYRLYNTIDYFTIAAAPLFFYRQGFFYIGPVLAIKIKDEMEFLQGEGLNSNINTAASTNFGFTVGGGWRVDFLYGIRLLVSLEFKYYALSWMKDAESSRWTPWGIYLKLSLLFGIGNPPPLNE